MTEISTLNFNLVLEIERSLDVGRPKKRAVGTATKLKDVTIVSLPVPVNLPASFSAALILDQIAL